MITASAPGKIILFGELAVVFNRLGISCAVDLRTIVNIKESNKGEIYSSKYGKLWKYNQKEIISIRKRYDDIISNKEYDKLRNYKISHPTKFLLSKIFKEIGYKNLSISIDTELPKGIGSSGSLSCALTLGTYKLFNHKITKDKIASTSIHLDKIAHGGTPSGIDTSTSTYGGFVTFRKTEGIKNLNIKSKIPILIVDSNTISKTSITVNHVRCLLEKNFKKTNNILDAIDSISNNAIDYLKNENKEKLGGLMDKNQDLLIKLGVSTNKINNLIMYLKKKHNIYGAKLTGGGRGGSIILLAEGYSGIISDLRKKGFRSFLVYTGAEGVRDEPVVRASANSS